MSDDEDWLTLEELTELLAEVTDASVEEIEQASEELEIAPPEEATVVGESEDNLEAHRKRIREIIDEHHEVFDALAGIEPEEDDDDE